MTDERNTDSSAPNAGNQQRDPRQDAGQDPSIETRLARDPDDVDARLDEALDETMDASDPVALTEPGVSFATPPKSDE